MYGFARAIQAFGIDRFRKNCQKQVDGFNYILIKMFRPIVVTNPEETITSHIPASSGKEKLIDAAKKASDLAKAKAGTMYASCHPSQT